MTRRSTPHDWETLHARLSAAPHDEEAWQAFFQRAWPYVLAVTSRALGGAGTLAEDAAQETFVRLARYCDFTEIADADGLRAYVAETARNVARNYLRQLAAARERGERPAVTPGTSEPEDVRQPSPAAEMERNELLEIVILPRLDETDRLIVRLLVDGYALPEIVTKTGLSYSNVATRVHRIRKKIRK